MLLKVGLPIFAAAMLVFAVVMVVMSKPERQLISPPLPPPAATASAHIAALGLVEAGSENISIGTPIAGLVMRVYVKAGDKVLKGQALFSLDDRDLQAELALRRSAAELTRRKLERLRQLPRADEIPVAEARVREAEAHLADTQVQHRLMESVTDKRAIREEELERRRAAEVEAQARLDEAKASLALIKAGPWQADLDVARAEVAAAESNVHRIEADLSRLTVTAPVAGQILQCRIHAGEYAATGVPQPLMLLGTTDDLHLRVDVSEEDSHRFLPDAIATASPRGDSTRKFPLRFIRFEPYVVPKKNFSGDSVERNDTRVLQVLYALDPGARVRPGEQMDVFIDAGAGERR